MLKVSNFKSLITLLCFCILPKMIMFSFPKTNKNVNIEAFEMASL